MLSASVGMRIFEMEINSVIRIFYDFFVAIIL